MENLILCGFMGSGKTTSGRLLATRLCMEYLDLDASIEQEAGKPIPHIFAQEGEQAFRDLEHAAICALAQRRRCIVSTGGGAMTYPRNVAAVSPSDIVVFLDADFETCYRRIEHSDRPLVRSNSPEGLRRLFEARREAYLHAASVVVDAAPPPGAVADAVLKKLPAIYRDISTQGL